MYTQCTATSFGMCCVLRLLSKQCTVLTVYEHITDSRFVFLPCACVSCTLVCCCCFCVLFATKHQHMWLLLHTCGSFSILSSDTSCSLPVSPGLRVMMLSLIHSLPRLRDILLLFFFFFLMTGLMGMQLYFGRLRQHCFVTEQGMLVQK